MYQVSSFGRVRSLDRYVNSSGGRQQHIKGNVLKYIDWLQKHL